MGRRLTANTVLTNPKTGSPVVFEEGQEVPAWAAALITTPGLLDGGKAPAKASGKKADPTPEEPDEPDTGDDDEIDDTPVSIPPLKGSGSGVAAWRKYALSKGFEFDDDVKRDEILAALAAENIPTE